MAEMYFSVGSLVVSGDVACGVFDGVGEPFDARETVVDGVGALEGDFGGCV